MSARRWMIACIGVVTTVGLAAAQEGSASGPEITEGIVTAPPAEVWRVFATPEGFKRLGVAQCDLDLRVGGLIRTHYDAKGVLGDEGTIQNEILSFEPGRMLSIRIRKPPKGFPFSEATWKETWSVITLTDLGDGRTHVRLAGLGYPDTDEGRKMREFFRAGNAWVFSFLKKHYDAAAPAPASRAHPDNPLTPITLDVVVERPRADVWAAFTTGAGWKRFFGVEAEIEHRPGGKFEILFGADAPPGQRGSEGCTVLSFVPQEMFSFTWSAPPKFERARKLHTFVVVTFEAISPSRTRVRLLHQGFAEQAALNPAHKAEWESVRTYFEAAWPKVLGALAR
jgi:uncharacterized protein YndB with AHSA1/START domain